MSEDTNLTTNQPGEVGDLLAGVDEALTTAEGYPGLGPVVVAVQRLRAAVEALAARVA